MPSVLPQCATRRQLPRVTAPAITSGSFVGPRSTFQSRSAALEYRSRRKSVLPLDAESPLVTEARGTAVFTTVDSRTVARLMLRSGNELLRELTASAKSRHAIAWSLVGTTARSTTSASRNTAIPYLRRTLRTAMGTSTQRDIGESKLARAKACLSTATSWRNISAGHSSSLRRFITAMETSSTTVSKTSNCGTRVILAASASRTSSCSPARSLRCTETW